jgi:RNA polymerase sigma factor (sigma-70 family)
MQKWQRERNYKKRQSADGVWIYLIEIDNEKIEVTREVYEAYATYDRRERYQAERDVGRLSPLERADEGLDGSILARSGMRYAEPAEDAALREMDCDLVRAALETLEPKERHMIEALVFDGMTEREYAAKLGIAQKNVNKKKQRVLLRLRKILST